MKRTLLAAALGLALVAGAPAASAATFISFTGPATDGSIAGVFGNTGGMTLGTFTDTFDFTWPAPGVTSGTISSSFTSHSNDLNLTSVTLNGVEFTTVIGGAGFPEFRLTTSQVTLSGAQVLTVKGFTPGAAATYSGTLTFTPSGTGVPGSIPEPAAWALMILGFGGVGTQLRRRALATARSA